MAGAVYLSAVSRAATDSARPPGGSITSVTAGPIRATPSVVHGGHPSAIHVTSCGTSNDVACTCHMVQCGW